MMTEPSEKIMKGMKPVHHSSSSDLEKAMNDTYLTDEILIEFVAVTRLTNFSIKTETN